MTNILFFEYFYIIFSLLITFIVFYLTSNTSNTSKKNIYQLINNINKLNDISSDILIKYISSLNSTNKYPKNYIDFFVNNSEHIILIKKLEYINNNNNNNNNNVESFNKYISVNLDNIIDEYYKIYKFNHDNTKKK